MSAVKKISKNLSIIEEFNDFDFFKTFPKDLLVSLSEMTSIVNYPPGIEILQQGQVNNVLYFLISGTVEVYVDGGLVAEIDGNGGLLGEMSVIADQPCGATIITESSCRLYRVDASELKNATGKNAKELEHILYKIFALILTQKLNETNQKAKHFEALTQELGNTQNELEETNLGLEKKIEERTRDLKAKTDELLNSHGDLESKNQELVTSHLKLEELYSNRDVTFKSLEELYQNELTHLQFTLVQLKSSADKEALLSIEASQDRLQDVMSLLEPITQRYTAEKELVNKKVLLADSNRKQQVSAKLALGGTGVELEAITSLEEGKLKLDENAYNIIFLSADMLELNAYAKNLYPNSDVVLMTSEKIENYLPTLQKFDQLPNIISVDPEDKTFTIKNIVTSVTKLISKNIFGLEKYFAWGVNINEEIISSSKKRSDVIANMSARLKSVGIRGSVLSQCQIVTEELLMNAIYDAPTDSDGNSKYNHLPRTTDVNLEPSEYSTIRYASDGMLLAISVEDPFGSLNGNIILNYLKSCYSGEEGELNKEKGGAGRGLHQIIENSDLVVFNIKKSKKTEVIALFNVDPKHSKKGPSFHLFYS